VLEQVWFPGVHCDVGGAYYNAAGLSDEALYWMMQKASHCGLLFRDQACNFGFNNAPDPFARLHDSYSLPFRIIDFILQKFKGEPRFYQDEPKYCAELSLSALMLHFSTKQEWPSTFVRALDRTLTSISLGHLKFPLKRIQPNPPAVPARKTTAAFSRPIIASERWDATGIHLNKGARYVITFVSPLDVHHANIHVTTLRGWPWSWRPIIFLPLALLLRRRRFAPWFGLIGSVDKKRCLRISDDRAEITAPATRELFCYFNDVPFLYKNNHGSITLSVDTI
jgi:hypothetical protein